MTISIKDSPAAVRQGAWLNADVSFARRPTGTNGHFVTGNGPKSEAAINFPPPLAGFAEAAMWELCFLAPYCDLGGWKQLEANMRFLGNKPDARQLKVCIFRHAQFTKVALETALRAPLVTGIGYLSKIKDDKEIWTGRPVVMQSFTTTFCKNNQKPRSCQNTFFWFFSNDKLLADIEQYSGVLLRLMGRLLDVKISVQGVNETRVMPELTSLQPVEAKKSQYAPPQAATPQGESLNVNCA